MKVFATTAFATLVSASIVNVVKRAEDCSVAACVKAHSTLARKGCIDGANNYADCICSMSDGFFEDLFECSQSCNQWEGTMIHGPDDLKDLYCAIALNTALTMDDPAPVTEKDEVTTRSSTTSKTSSSRSTTTRASSTSTTGELSSESDEPTETEESSSSADTGSKSVVSILGLLAALII